MRWAMAASSCDSLPAEARALILDQLRHVGIGRKQVREYRQQAVTVPRDLAPRISRSRTAKEFPVRPRVGDERLPRALRTRIGTGTASCVCPPRITSIPVTRRCELFRSTSIPLCDSSATTRRPLPRASSTTPCSRFFLDAESPVGDEARGMRDGRI